MLKNDKWIKEMALKGMISPFEENQVRQVDNNPVISYGLSSYGYDLRLSDAEFKVFRESPNKIVDVKRFDPGHLMYTRLIKENNEKYFILPAHSYGLGCALEKLEIPSNVTAICVGKSTYARAGIIANITPGEAGWNGHLTLEFSNSSSSDCKIYALEGIVQLLFFEGEPCDIDYQQRNGKYQGQPEIITLPLV